MRRQITVLEMAEKLGGEAVGNVHNVIAGVQSLLDAKEDDVSFLGNIQYKDQVAKTKAGAVIVSKKSNLELREGCAFIYVDDPNLAFSKAIDLFAPEPIIARKGTHHTAVVAESAKIGKNVSIGANVVIEDHAVIGDNTVIKANCYIGHFTTIGNDCLLYPTVTIRERCIIGNRVILHPGVVIGADGFGFAPSAQGIIKIPQIGIVQLDDDVEIGANTTVDRARFGKTWLKQGVKVDNLVQIGHNVIIGEFSMIVGQAGIAGSTKLGRGVIVAGQAGVNGHITLGDGAKVAGCASVLKSVAPGEQVVGMPAESPRDFIERISLPKKLKRLTAKIKNLENDIKALKNG